MKYFIILFFTLTTFALNGQGNFYLGAGVATSQINVLSDAKSLEDNFRGGAVLGWQYKFSDDGHRIMTEAVVTYDGSNVDYNGSFIVALNALPIANKKNFELGVLLGGGMQYNSLLPGGVDYLFDSRMNLRVGVMTIATGVQIPVVEAFYYGSHPEYFARVLFNF